MTRLACWLGGIVAFCLTTEAIAEAPASILSGVAVHVAANSVNVGTEITIDGQPAAAFWEKYFADLFAILDRNNDGWLDRNETARVPRPASLLAEFRGDFDNVTAEFASPTDMDRTPADGKISCDELAQYLRRAGVGAGEVRVEGATEGLDVATTRRLFESLASPQGTWDSTSFASADLRLRQFDTNDDERLSFAELRLVTKVASSPMASNVRRTLSVSPIIQAEGANAPSVKLKIRLGGSTASGSGFEISSDSAVGGELPLQLDAIRLSLNAVPGFGREDFDSSRQSLLQQFDADDADHNQILDRREVQLATSSGYYSLLSAVADRNSDGRLSAQELNRYLTLPASAAQHSVVITAHDRGSSLAACLDADGDAQLSLRELRHGWPRVAGWDRNGDHGLAWDEVPHECQLTWSVGRPKLQTAAHASLKSGSPAPRWFLRMDRNEDGNLSRSEFLGTQSDFRRYDADGDGLVSPTEANRATKD